MAQQSEAAETAANQSDDAVSQGDEPSTTAMSGAINRQSRELATSALFGYGIIVMLRMTGISGLVFYPHAENPFFASSLHSVGVFVFYDGFGLALLALCFSGYVTLRGWTDLLGTQSSAKTLDIIASIGLSVVSLVYLIGIVLTLLG